MVSLLDQISRLFQINSIDLENFQRILGLFLVVLLGFLLLNICFQFFWMIFQKDKTYGIQKIIKNLIFFLFLLFLIYYIGIQGQIFTFSNYSPGYV